MLEYCFTKDFCMTKATPALEARLEGYKNILIPLICARIPNCTIYLFGSRARKDYHEGADIDIAIDAGSPLPFAQLALLQDDLNATYIPVAVDFIDLHSVDKSFWDHVLNEGIIWKHST